MTITTARVRKRELDRKEKRTGMISQVLSYTTTYSILPRYDCLVFHWGLFLEIRHRRKPNAYILSIPPPLNLLLTRWRSPTRLVIYTLPRYRLCSLLLAPRLADSIEMIMSAHCYDGNISIPGCDKNMPGCLIAAARHNRPTIVIYGGTILSGARTIDCPALGAKAGDPINIGSVYESYGSYISGKTSKEQHEDVVAHSCPGPGGCGGMFTANTVSYLRMYTGRPGGAPEVT